jgi:CDP-diacylglycerol---glycerol-3-phosphate 3-phosphatidyltransferase
MRGASDESVAARDSRGCHRHDPPDSRTVTFTGAIGRACHFPLRLIIAALAQGHFLTAGGIMIVANIFDFIDGKVATITGKGSDFGGFWDSVIDRFSDLALSVGLICLYSSLGRTDYVLITSIAMVFATMTSYTRARAESLITKCKVGFMERPERIVLFMIGAFTNRMAAVMWVIGVLSVVSVVNRIQYTSGHSRDAAAPSASSSAPSTGPTTARRSPTTSGSSRSSPSSGSPRPIGSATRWRKARGD